MVGFTKLHSTIIHSSIWQECAETCKVWVTMLAMADKDGIVEASISGLARASNLNVEAVEVALECFLGPDPDSRDGTTGERIEKVPGGWLLLNHANYRELRTREQEATAERVRRHRERQGVTSIEVTGCNGLKRLPASASASDSAFEAFWTAFDRKVARPDALRAWKRLSPDEALAAVIVEKAKAWAEATPDKAFRPYPATWLNRRGWEDELPAKPQPRVSPRTIASSTQHIPNMPLGSAMCQCQGCVDYRAKRAQ